MTNTRAARFARAAAARRPLRQTAVALFGIVLVSSGSCVEQQPVQPGEEVAHTRVSDSRLEGSDVVVSWNELAYEIAYAEDQFLTFKGQRALAMMHLAMHDALNTIRPRYERYAYTGHRSAADPTTAAAQAAYEVLVSQYPNRRSSLDSALASWFDRAPRPRRARAAELGKAAAAAILAGRDGDGWDDPGSYTFVEAPGQYRTTPPWNGFVAQPGFRAARPFVLDSGDQLRPEPPPALSSAGYTRAFDEVKAFGAANSALRTPDQTGYAVWWMEFAEGSVSRLARQLLEQHRMDAWTANRMFAHMYMALFDSYVSVWDSKYEHNHWRPYTAVRRADSDGNPATSPDPQWEPLRPTPPFPEYVSAHAAGCAASLTILARNFGDDVAFTMTTLTAPADMPIRSFSSFSQAASECADSRIRIGWHFRYATNRGNALGRRVADFVVDRELWRIR